MDRAAVNMEIRSIARVASLDQNWIDGQIDAGATVDAARAAAFEAMQTRSQAGAGLRTHATIGTDYTDPEFRARTIGEALYTRVTPGHTPSEAARPYVGLSIPDVARDCLRNRGFSTTGLGASTIIERALQSTSDFPLILADALDKTLRQAYQTAPAGVRQVARATTARDFRNKHRIQFSTAPTLLPLNEHGEFVSGAMNEYDQTYARHDVWSHRRLHPPGDGQRRPRRVRRHDAPHGRGCGGVRGDVPGQYRVEQSHARRRQSGVLERPWQHHRQRSRHDALRDDASARRVRPCARRPACSAS